MEGPRPPLDTEFADVVKFLDRELRPSADWSIAAEYPVAFDPTNAGNLRIVRDDSGQIVSHALMRPLIVKSPAGLYKVAAIGSVVTQSDRRSEGLSGRILESCLTSARDHGCDFAILWTNLYDHYRKLGFELAGVEVSATIERELNVALPAGWRVHEGARVAPDAIHRLFSQHTVTSLRTADETRRYMQIPNSRLYTFWDAGGALKAYVAEGKGADLDGYAHEWGGGVSSLLPLLSYVRAKQARPITVIMPAHAANLARSLREGGAVLNQGYLGMIKILNPSNFFAKLKRHARSLGREDFVFEKQGERFYLGSRSNVFMTDSESDVVRLAFGPQKARDLHAFDAPTLEILEAVLPIPMWIWGWDSV